MTNTTTKSANPNPDANTSFATPNHTPQLEAFKQVVEQRRSVRVFKDTPISDAVLDECLRLAILAPNSSNLQPWEFYIIESADKRAQASKICMNQNAAKTANKLVAVVARTDTWADNAKQIIKEYPTKPLPSAVTDYYGKLIPLTFTRGPANVFAIPKRVGITAHRKLKGPIKTPMYSYKQVKNWATNNSFLAAQNFMLAMRAHGFDTCAMGGFDEPAMKKLLGLGEHQHIAMMIGCGERDDSGIYGEQYRFDFKQSVFRV